MENLSKKMVEKSIEAFIMGLEIYNKPTIKYRIEGFSFFICNAWELMLKSYLVKTKGELHIYYKDNPEKTISLTNAIDLIFTDKHGNLRKNLLQIIELRNTSTHFITEDYEHIYAPLFQACVINYINKMQDFHNVDITQYIAQNFLTLSIRLDHLSEEQIRAKYTPTMAKKILNTEERISRQIEEGNNDYAIPIITKFYITKNKNDADLSINVSKNADISVAMVKEMKDPNNLYPLTTLEVINIVNRSLKNKNINLTKNTNKGPTNTPFNRYHFKLFNTFYDIKGNPDYCFFYKIGNRYGYSQKLCNFIVEEILKDPVHFVENMKIFKKK